MTEEEKVLFYFGRGERTGAAARKNAFRGAGIFVSAVVLFLAMTALMEAVFLW